MSAHYILHGPHSLAELVSRRLTNERFWWSRDVEAQVTDDEVRLTGRVRSYYLKQVAQESLRGLQGLRRIHNELCVVR
ncbi:MAG TPA: BON domain-containing protein [Planctomycetaceae bacterium]|nr:BON domain-containing protein [Planctomycetaceae bacterium]